MDQGLEAWRLEHRPRADGRKVSKDHDLGQRPSGLRLRRRYGKGRARWQAELRPPKGTGSARTGGEHRSAGTWRRQLAQGGQVPLEEHQDQAARLIPRPGTRVWCTMRRGAATKIATV